MNHLTFSSQGGLLAIVFPNIVKIINILNWHVIQDYECKSEEMLGDPDFSHNSELVSSSLGGRNEVYIWKVSDGSLVQTIAAHIGGINRTTFFQGIRILITAGLKDGFVRFWDIIEGNNLFQ